MFIRFFVAFLAALKRICLSSYTRLSAGFNPVLPVRLEQCSEQVPSVFVQDFSDSLQGRDFCFT